MRRGLEKHFPPRSVSVTTVADQGDWCPRFYGFIVNVCSKTNRNGEIKPELGLKEARINRALTGVSEPRDGRRCQRAIRDVASTTHKTQEAEDQHEMKQFK